MPSSDRLRVLGLALKGLFTRQQPEKKPKSSRVLEAYLRQKHYPYWTAWYVPYCDVRNDLWGQSHFNFDVDGRNYHVLRTGAFPFVKFHCTLRPVQDLTLEDNFYKCLKVINLGIPTLLYGLAGLLWTKHTETVTLEDNLKLKLYFWYKETPNSPV